MAYASTSPSSCARTLPTLAGVSESSAAGGCVAARGGSSSAVSAASAHSTYGMRLQAVSVHAMPCHIPHAHVYMHMHMHMCMCMLCVCMHMQHAHAHATCARACGYTLRSAPARRGPGKGRSRAHWSACMAKCIGIVDLDGA